MLSAILAMLVVVPWAGHDLPTATEAAAKFRVTVSGAPGSSVHLTASGVAKGWIAAFCDMRVCSPWQATEKIPASGRAVIQFELIRETDSAPRRSGATIHGSDGSVVAVPLSS